MSAQSGTPAGFADVAQLVEHHVAIVDVEGSSPFVRFRKESRASFCTRLAASRERPSLV